MTEAEWSRATDPQAMLEFLRDSGKLSERKARLFAVACCRRVWHLLGGESSRQAVATVERYAEGLASHQEMRAAEKEADEDDCSSNFSVWLAQGAVSRAAYIVSEVASPMAKALGAAGTVASLAAKAALQQDVRSKAEEGSTDRRRLEFAAQAALLRDIFGPLPFRPLPPLNPAVLAWHEGTVVRLAKAAYQERELPGGHLDRHRLVVLADALEEAGCTDEDILGHVRGSGPHTRGCWVLDMLTGRE